MSELENFDKLCENERRIARKQGNPCAWCDNEKGVERKADDNKVSQVSQVSHGICERHQTELLLSVYEHLASEWGYMI